MILRVYRGRVIAGREAELDVFLRSEAVPGALSVPGLQSFQPGLRERAGQHELTIISTWTDFDALAAFGRGLDSPLAVPDAARLLEEGRADHFELVSGGARGLPFGATTLRVTRGTLRANMGPTFFTQARAQAEPHLDDAALIGLHIGRRMVEGAEEAVAVSLWGADDALDQPRFEITARASDGTPFFEGDGPHDELYRALTMTAPADDAPAILLADDQRRYLHATPAAARLTGQSIARLLTMRVDDLAAPEVRSAVPAMWDSFLAAGALEGSFALSRRDGSILPVQFTARARSPWPGCHASVLVPAESEPVAFDEALAAAGFVSRYAAAI